MDMSSCGDSCAMGDDMGPCGDSCAMGDDMGPYGDPCAMGDDMVPCGDSCAMGFGTLSFLAKDPWIVKIPSRANPFPRHEQGAF